MEQRDGRLLERITANRQVFNGRPTVRGMRIPGALILALLAQGVSHEEILDDYPDLEPEYVRACIAYAYARAVIAHDALDAVLV